MSFNWRRGRTAAFTAAALFLAVLLCLPPSASAAFGDKAKIPEIPGRYRKWLNEEVVYIITPIEREVFLKLTSDRERDMFIEAFWKHRDPNEATGENEFKAEHYRRIEYADRYLGAETNRPGWMTDRGRIYILLGHPKDIQRFEGRSEIYDCESWFYQDMQNLGLPVGFYLLFFRSHGLGEYRLYSPLQDGPQSLLSSYRGDVTDYQTAYKRLRDADETLATESMSLIPGEDLTNSGRPSMISDLLIQRISAVPEKLVEDRYAKKFLEYKDIVEVEYTANYLDSNSLVRVFRDQAGHDLVHVAVEPKRLTVNQMDRRFFTALDVSCRVADAAGRSVYQFDRKVSLELTPEQMGSASRLPYDFQDVFPLVPGDYSLSVLIKNEASKEFSSVEEKIRVPSAAGPSLSQPVLGYKAARLGPGEGKVKPFRVGPYQLSCQPGNVFTVSDTLVIAFQVNAPGGGRPAPGDEVRISLIKGDAPFREYVHKASECPDLPAVVEEVPLRDFEPAHYRVTAAWTSAGKTISASDEFDLSFAASVPRPWSSSRVLPDSGDAFYPYTIGTQLLALGRAGEALPLIEDAVRRGPGDENSASSLARTYLALGRTAEARGTIEPFVGPDRAPAYDVFMLAAGIFRAAGDGAASVAALERAGERFGINASIMNALGESYLLLGRKADALASFRKSLELSPDQPEIRKKAGELEKK